MSNPSASVWPSGDFCTFITSAPLGFDFTAACMALDINLGPQSSMSFSEATSAFRSDLHSICSAQYGDSWLCHFTAEVVFIGVSLFGPTAPQAPGGN